MSLEASLTVIRGACGHDCPDTCTWMVETRSGKAERLYGDPEHPFTRGTLCAKVNHYLDRVYHPDRVLSPLKRTGKKGDGQFVRTTWDEALADIAGRWKSIIADSGAEAILPYSYLVTKLQLGNAPLRSSAWRSPSHPEMEEAITKGSPRTPSSSNLAHFFSLGYSNLVSCLLNPSFDAHEKTEPDKINARAIHLL